MWKAVTGLAILILGALLVGLVWLSSTVLGYLQPVLVPLAVAGIIAYLLDPVVQWLQKRGLTRMKGILAVYGALILFFAILSAIISVPLSSQLEKLVGNGDEESTEQVEAAGEGDGGILGWKGNQGRIIEEKTLADAKTGLFGWFVKLAAKKDVETADEHLRHGGVITGLKERQWALDGAGVLELRGAGPDGLSAEEEQERNFILSDWAGELEVEGVDYPEEYIVLENRDLTIAGTKISGNLAKISGWLFNSSGKILGFFGVVLGFVMVPIYLYYFLKESDAIKNGWTDYVPLKASGFKDQVVLTLREVNGYLISFFRGQVLVAFIDGILVGIALTFYGLNYGLLIGILMAILGIVPYIGSVLCLIPACIIAYFQGAQEPWGLPQWGYVAGVVAIFVVVQQINSLVTAPKIVGDSVGLHPMTVIFSMLFWSLLLGGFLGALLAVPLTASVKVLFQRYVWDKQDFEKRELGEPA